MTNYKKKFCWSWVSKEISWNNSRNYIHVVWGFLLLTKLQMLSSAIRYVLLRKNSTNQDFQSSDPCNEMWFSFFFILFYSCASMTVLKHGFGVLLVALFQTILILKLTIKALYLKKIKLGLKVVKTFPFK